MTRNNITHFFPCATFSSAQKLIGEIESKFSVNVDSRGSKLVEASETKEGVNITVYPSETGEENTALFNLVCQFVSGLEIEGEKFSPEQSLGHVNPEVRSIRSEYFPKPKIR